MQMKPYAGLTAVIYARVSTDDHDQNPESQLVALRQWCAEQSVTVVGEYADKVTGTTLERPQLDALLGRIMRDRVPLIIALDADRVSRSVDDKAKLLRMLQPYGTVIRYIADYSASPETEEGRILDDLKTYGAQKYVSGHRLKIKAGLERARQQGTRSGKAIGRPRTVIDNDTLIEGVRERCTMVQLADIFHTSRETIRRRLNDLGMMEEYKARQEGRL